MLMKSLISVEGLTRGRGMSDVQRGIYIRSRPATSDINESMQIFCGTMHTTREQHIETNISTRKRDKWTLKWSEYLFERNPFNTERYYQWGSFTCQWCRSDKRYWRESSIKTGWENSETIHIQEERYSCANKWHGKQKYTRDPTSANYPPMNFATTHWHYLKCHH